MRKAMSKRLTSGDRRARDGSAGAAVASIARAYPAATPAMKPEPFDPTALASPRLNIRRLWHYAARPSDRYVNDDQIRQAIAQMLSRIGIQTRVETLPSAVYFSRANKLEFSLMLVGWAADTAEASSPLKAQLATYDAKKGMGTANRGRYSNAKMDALLEQALATVDDAKREKLLQQATELGVGDLGAFPASSSVNGQRARHRVYTPRTDERTSPTNSAPQWTGIKPTDEQIVAARSPSSSILPLHPLLTWSNHDCPPVIRHIVIAKSRAAARLRRRIRHGLAADCPLRSTRTSTTRRRTTSIAEQIFNKLIDRCAPEPKPALAPVSWRTVDELTRESAAPGVKFTDRIFTAADVAFSMNDAIPTSSGFTVCRAPSEKPSPIHTIRLKTRRLSEPADRHGGTHHRVEQGRRVQASSLEDSGKATIGTVQGNSCAMPRRPHRSRAQRQLLGREPAGKSIISPDHPTLAYVALLAGDVQ